MITLIRLAKKKKAAKASTPGSSASKKVKPPCSHQLQGTQDVDVLLGRGAFGQEPREVNDPLKDIHYLAPPATLDDVGKCNSCKFEKRAARNYRRKVVLGLILPFALQALDTTIIASALPWIAVDFGEVAQLNWIISAFNLSSAAFIPFWGQLANIFGRHYTLQACVVVMMLGSALCTGAPTDAFPLLLLGRGIQGLGCAGISVIVRIILADKVSLEENARNGSLFTITAGTMYGIGPVIGGYLTSSNWRWCFAINLPVCLAAIILIFLLLRKELLGPQAMPAVDGTVEGSRRARFATRLMTIDVGGQLLFLFGFGLIVLALTWAGATYSWGSVYVLAPLCIGFVLVGAFGFYEKLMAPEGFLSRKWPLQNAMVPWELLANRDMGLMFYITCCTGAAMYSVDTHSSSSIITA
jgi:MFS family permease